MHYQNPMQPMVMPGIGSYPRVDSQQAGVINSRVLGYLGRGLSLEFSAGQHYLAQASLAKLRNEVDYAEGFVTMANEEFQHANLLTDRLVALGAVPSGSVLSPATASNSIIESLRSCEAKELVLIQLYNEATQLCANVGDSDNHALFNRLLAEEQDQLARVHAWLEQHYHSLNQTLATFPI